MAVKTSWSAGDVLTAADLTDTFAAKANYKYQTTAPTSPATGDLWMDTSGSSPVSKVYNGTAWVTFSGAGLLTAGDVSSTTGSPTITTFTGNGTIGLNGVGYTVYKFTGSGSITFAKAGLADVLVVGGGGGGGSASWYGGGGGGAGAYAYHANLYVTSGAWSVAVGAGGAINAAGGYSTFSKGGQDAYTYIGGGRGGIGGGEGSPANPGYDGGSGGGASAGASGASGGKTLNGVIHGNNGGSGGTGGAGSGGGAGGAGGTATVGGAGIANTISGSLVTYATGGAANAFGVTPPANSGNGGSDRGAGANGVVIIRVRS